MSGLELSLPNSTMPAKGIVFTFIRDMQISCYVSKDPIFDRVIGYQPNLSFITEEMINHIKMETVKASDDSDGTDLSMYQYPMSEKDIVSLLYEYRVCMEPCKFEDSFRASYTTMF